MPLNSSEEEGVMVKIVLDECLRERNENEFVRYLKENKTYKNEEIDIGHGATNTYLQYCCKEELIKAARYLIENEADVTKTGKFEDKTPLEMACYKGFATLVELILSKTPMAAIEDEIVKKCFMYTIKNHANFETKNRNRSKCFDLIMDEVKKRDIQDFKESSFTCALEYGNDDAAAEILDSMLDNVTEEIVKKASSSTIKKYMDKCSRFPEKNGTNRSEIHFDYTKWISSENRNGVLPCESERFYWLTAYPKFECLFNHPFILCFLVLKWKKVRKWYWVHVLLYAALVVGTWIYIALTGNYLLFSIFCFILSLPYISFSFCTKSKRHAISLGCIFLISIILLCITVIIITIFMRINMQKMGVGVEIAQNIMQFSLSTIILLQSLSILAHFRVIRCEMEMFNVVLRNFTDLLLCYVFLIVAFMTSFYVISIGGKQVDATITNNTNTSSHDSGNTFYTIFTLLVGNTDDDVFYNSSFAGKIFVIASIFVISIVFVNLLNGLAVGEVGNLLKKAELVTHREKICCIYSMEILYNILNRYCYNCVKSFYQIDLFQDRKIIVKCVLNKADREPSPETTDLDKQMVERFNEYFKNTTIYHCTIEQPAKHHVISCNIPLDDIEIIRNTENLP